DFTKIYGKNSFKMGMEWQNVHFNTLQPAFSRGQFNFDGNYAGVPSQSGDQTGRAAMLLTPTNSTVGGPNGIGGANQVQGSNIAKTYDQRIYLAFYFQDDIKVTPTLTLNLGLRWDYFSPISETNGAQANFVQSGPPGGPVYLIPATGKANRQLSSTANNPSLNGQGFLDLLAKDGIALGSTNKYGNALVQTQKNNIAPRFGFAYQATPKLVVRGGVGLFYDRVGSSKFVHAVEQGNPYAATLDYAGGAAAPYSLANPFPSTPLGFTPRWFDPVTGLNSALNTPFYSVIHTPLTRQYNLTFQYEFLKGWVLETGFVGSSSINQANYNHNYNLAQLASPSNPINGQTTNTLANAVYRVPYLGYQAIGLQGTAYDAYANYNSFQATVRKQFSRG